MMAPARKATAAIIQSLGCMFLKKSMVLLLLLTCRRP
jgi:hypothetical protein